MEGEEGKDFIMVRDFHAYNIYFDGTRGPKTGAIKAIKMQLGKTVDLEFWHGHGGKKHRFKVTQKEFQQIILGKVVDIQTDSVANHTHTVRLDMSKVVDNSQTPIPVKIVKKSQELTETESNNYPH